MIPAASARADAVPRPNAPVVLGLRRVYILPTRTGLGFSGVLLVMLVGSVNYDNGLGYLLSFLLFSMALVSVLHTYRNMAGLSVTGCRARPVFAGQEALFSVHLHNEHGPARHGVRVTPTGVENGQAATVHPRAGEPFSVTLPVRAERRGRLALPAVTLSTRYPMGLFRAWSRVALGTGCLVYPRPAGGLPLPQPARGQLHEEGLRGQGREDFTGFRDYLPGDSPRRIHWKAVARERGTPVKLFAGGGSTDLELRWEDAGPGGAEARLSQLCRWVLDAEHHHLRYGLSLPGVTVPSGLGDAHLHRCLAELALFEQHGA